MNKNSKIENYSRLPMCKIHAPIPGYNVVDAEKFKSAIKLLQQSLTPESQETTFIGDNLITWNKNLSFLREDFYVDLLKGTELSIFEKSNIWRTYILLYFAEKALKLQGDYLELGCYLGTTAKLVLEKCNLKRLNKKYYLYDPFGWKEDDKNHPMPEHENPEMYNSVVKRFSNQSEVKIIRGYVPDSLNEAFPEKVAFAHIDMNNPYAESKALERILPKLSKHGIIIFDDYGWWGYSAQKKAIDPIVKKYKESILELPTGQGMLIKA